MGTAHDRITAALTAHGCHGRGRSWQCPAHDDRTPSMTVTPLDGTVLIHCQAGCTPEAIMTELGLSKADLFDEPLAPRREIARYYYRDTAGDILYSKVRYEPKHFLVQHMNGNGWANGIGNALRVLYRLPELKQAVADGKTIYLPEGEKDVDRLWKEGCAATCNHDGAAGRWRPEYSDQLTGADVIIIADRDEPGYAHAVTVKNSLTGKARSVRVVQAAIDRKGADVSDHLDEGYTLDQLVPVGPDATFKPVSLLALIQNGVPAPVLLCGGMLYQAGLHSIAGAPDSGKTTIALWWALQLLQCGRNVIFLDEEGGPEIVAEKLIALGATPLEMRWLTYIPFPGRSWSSEDTTALADLAQGTRPAMVLWDSSAAFLARAGMDENAASDTTSFWARVLTPLARDHRAAVVVIDHDAKNTEQSRYARGSGAKLAACDVAYKVEMLRPFSREQDGLLKVTATKDRRGRLHRNWKATMITGEGAISPGLEKDYDETETERERWPPSRHKIYDFLSTVVPRSTVEIAMAVALARETASRELHELMRAGYASKTGGAGDHSAATWKKLK